MKEIETPPPFICYCSLLEDFLIIVMSLFLSKLHDIDHSFSRNSWWVLIKILFNYLIELNDLDIILNSYIFRVYTSTQNFYGDNIKFYKVYIIYLFLFKFRQSNSTRWYDFREFFLRWNQVFKIYFWNKFKHILYIYI